MSTTVLNVNPIAKLTRDRFFALCAANPDAKLELSKDGGIYQQRLSLGMAHRSKK